MPAAEQPTQLTLDLGDRPRLTAGAGLPEMTGPERVRAELDVLGLDVSAHVVEFYAPLLRRARGHPQPRPARRPQPQRGVGGRGQGRHPDPAGALRAPGRLPHPRRLHRAVGLHLLRGRPGPLRRGGLPLLAAARARCRCAAPATAGSRSGPPAPGSSPPLWDAWQLGGLAGARAAIAAGEAEARARAEATEQAARERDARTGRRVLVHASGFKQSPYADIRPPGADPRSGRGAPGAVVPAGAGRRAALAQAVARQPRQLRTLGWVPTHRPAAAPHPRRRPAVSDERSRPRRAGAQPGLRTAAVQAALDTLAARPQRRPRAPAAGARPRGWHRRHRRAARGGRPRRHRRRPEPRRPRLAGAAGPPRPAPRRASTPCRATPTPSASSAPAASGPPTTWSACHGTLEVVDDPDAALANIAAVLAPGGTLSLVVAQRLPAAPGPRPGRAVRPRPGDPRAARRALGRRRPRTAAVRRARGA